MGHDHNHSHGTENVSDGVLLWTVIVNLGLSVFEFVAGAISGSVALMADALQIPMMLRHCSSPILPVRFPARVLTSNILSGIDEPS